MASATFAFDAQYMAAATTMAGAVNLSFSSSASLEIFELSLGLEDRKMLVSDKSVSSERFNQCRGGAPGGIRGVSLDLVAGNMVNGNIGIWNPLALIRD